LRFVYNKNENVIQIPGTKGKFFMKKVRAEFAKKAAEIEAIKKEKVRSGFAL
jgi:hypothetical protein